MRSFRSRVALAVLIALCAPAAVPHPAAAATPGSPDFSNFQMSSPIIGPGGTVTFSATITATPCTPGVNCVSWTDIITGNTVYEADTIDAASWYAFQGSYVSGAPGPVTVTGGAFGTSVVDVTWTVPSRDLQYGGNTICLFAWQGADSTFGQQYGGTENYHCVQLQLAVGQVTQVVGDNIILHPDGSQTPAIVGSLIQQGDVIVTSATGAVNILFADNTTFAVSESARMSIDRYSFHVQDGTGSAIFRFLQGLFVYTSGLIAHNDPGSVQIETPVATLGIRGTELIGRYDPATWIGRVDLDLGSISVTPIYASVATTFDAPATMTFSAFGIQSSGLLSQATYDAEKQTILSLFNQAPTADAGGPYAGREGSAIPITATAADTDGDTVTTAWSYSAVSADPGATCSFVDAAAISTSVTCTDNGTFKLSLTANDGVNPPVTSDAMLTVANANPVASISAPQSGAVYAVGSTVGLNAPFNDAGTNDTHTCTIDWNVGAGPQQAAVAETLGSGACSGSTSYPAAGIYTAQVAVTDDDGGVGTASVDIVVYDPGAGFVTGGGWISSPAGAYVADPTLTGHANFAFVSGYRRGATVPTGNTEFQFQAGGLDFRSDQYQWLVVNQNGTNAQFKGTGTINGAGSYTFMIWATQGSPSTFRIQITDNNSGGALVYDNGAQQAIGGGSILVHT